MRRKLRIITIKKALTRLKTINDEIRYTSVAEGGGFNSGIISFRRRKRADMKQIKHSDRDVLCQVLKGSGRLRVDGRRIALKVGTLCHIPKGTPHDFAAAKNGNLVLFYSLIKTR